MKVRNIDGAIHRSLRVAGHRLNVVIRNPDAPGRPLLICNGVGASLKLFEPFTSHLRGTRCILFDVPGIGGSSRPWWPMRLPAYARLVTRLLDALEVEEADVLGFSWGTALAQELALRYPRRCRRLVLAAGMMGLGMVTASPWVLANLFMPLRYFWPGYSRRVLPTLFGGEFRNNRQAVEQYRARVVTPSMIGYYSQWYALLGWSSLGRLPQLHARTLIVAGNDDPIIPLVNAEIMARLIPDVRLHVVEDGHLFPLTRAGEFAGIVREFLGDEDHRHARQPDRRIA